MDRVPRFSIVTPSYNQAAFIAETIESVLSQEGPFEIEYVVMDGGSTDDSVEVITKYANRVAEGEWPVKCAGIAMSWVSQRDNGQSDAINQGLRRATGDIASYINSDDSYFPGAFARVAQEFAARPNVDFIYGDGDVIDEVGGRQWEWLSRPYNYAVMTSYHFLWNDFTNYIMQQATFWRRSVVDRIGYFDESFHHAMDVEYWIRAGHAGLKLHHMPDKLGKFRLIQGTKSLSSPTVFWEDYLEIYRRYRGSRALGVFFAYYYYNVARQHNFDLESTLEHGSKVFSRWKVLPLNEQRVITEQADYGFDMSCLLIAKELLRRGFSGRASTILRRGVSRRPVLIFHPFALGYIVAVALGPRFFMYLQLLSRRTVEWYRARRYNYRYRLKTTHGKT
jgi:glycosyltransferase involved in cell wall biosynthesis